jgi:hypothetical protein
MRRRHIGDCQEPIIPANLSGTRRPDADRDQAVSRPCLRQVSLLCHHFCRSIRGDQQALDCPDPPPNFFNKLDKFRAGEQQNIGRRDTVCPEFRSHRLGICSVVNYLDDAVRGMPDAASLAGEIYHALCHSS